MDSDRTITLRWIYHVPGDIHHQLARFRFSHPIPVWQPAINAYRCEDCIRVCLELAGVGRADIELAVEPYRITVRGIREVPEPADKKEAGGPRVLVMEIDYGTFERTIEFQQEIDVQKARAEHENGLLWIHLPLKS
jgi:HSP20 family protein